MTWVSDRKNASGGEELFCAKQEDVDLPHKCSYSWMFLWQWPVPNQSSQFAYSSKKMNRANWNLDHLSFSPGGRHVHGNISRVVNVWKWLYWLHNSNYQYYYHNENALLKKTVKRADLNCISSEWLQFLRYVLEQGTWFNKNDYSPFDDIQNSCIFPHVSSHVNFKTIAWCK